MVAVADRLVEDGQLVNGTIVKAIETAKELGYVETGDLTVATAGDPRMSVQLEDKVSSTNVAYVAQVR